MDESQYLRLCHRFIEKSLSGDLSIDDQIQTCDYMESSFPGKGWRDQMLWLIRKKNDESINNPPHFQDDWQNDVDPF
jgi:hypothetical protein